MNAAFSHIKADKIIRYGMGVSFLILMIHAIYLGISFFSLPPMVPLFNQMPWGDARLGTRIEILLPLIITGAFFGLNYFLMAKLYSTMPLVSRILCITVLLTTILSFIFIIRTLQLIL